MNIQIEDAYSDFIPYFYDEQELLDYMKYVTITATFALPDDVEAPVDSDYELSEELSDAIFEAIGKKYSTDLTGPEHLILTFADVLPDRTAVAKVDPISREWSDLLLNFRRAHATKQARLFRPTILPDHRKVLVLVGPDAVARRASTGDEIRIPMRYRVPGFTLLVDTVTLVNDKWQSSGAIEVLN